MDARPGSPGSCFAPWTTAGYAVLWLAVVVQGWSPLLEEDPVAWLLYPESSAERMTERDLELTEAIHDWDGPAGPLLEQLYGDPDEALAYAIEVQRDLLDRDDTEPTRDRLAVLLLDAGEREEALGLLDTAVVDDATLERLASAGLSDGYLDRAERAAANEAGDTARAAAADARLRARGRRWATRSLWLLAASGTLVVLGAALVAAAGARARPWLGGHGPGAPWSLADGIGVFVRGDFWNRLYFLILAWVSSQPAAEALGATPLGDLLYTWGSLFAALPLLWLVHRHLLRPAGLSAAAVFGLLPRLREGVRLLGVGLAAIAIDLIGTHAISWASWGIGVGSSWAEGFDEDLVWGSTAQATLTTIDYVAWAPAFEELAFRGILYLSLRQRLGPLPAALSTAAFFSLLHFYSLPGFGMTLWSALVWTLAFERTRSLLPGVAAHAVYNALFVAGLVLVYR